MKHKQLHYDTGHWEGGGEQGSAPGILSDPADFVPDGELHIDHIPGGRSIGGTHGVAPDNSIADRLGEHSAAQMSQVANDYLKLLGDTGRRSEAAQDAAIAEDNDADLGSEPDDDEDDPKPARGRR
jgi:hypothetical protein